jgi:hypothetical protein
LSTRARDRVGGTPPARRRLPPYRHHHLGITLGRAHRGWYATGTTGCRTSAACSFDARNPTSTPSTAHHPLAEPKEPHRRRAEAAHSVHAGEQQRRSAGRRDAPAPPALLRAQAVRRLGAPFATRTSVFVMKPVRAGDADGASAGGAVRAVVRGALRLGAAVTSRPVTGRPMGTGWCRRDCS